MGTTSYLSESMDKGCLFPRSHRRKDFFQAKEYDFIVPERGEVETELHVGAGVSGQLEYERIIYEEGMLLSLGYCLWGPLGLKQR